MFHWRNYAFLAYIGKCYKSCLDSMHLVDVSDEIDQFQRKSSNTELLGSMLNKSHYNQFLQKEVIVNNLFTIICTNSRTICSCIFFESYRGKCCFSLFGVYHPFR